MRTVLAVGIGLLVVGLTGYVAGIATPYPGRAFSVTAVMVGTTLVAMASPTISGAE